MSYYRPDETNIEINNQNLPKALKSLLLTEKIVRKKRKSESAIKISIAKWENIQTILKSLSSHHAPFVFYEEIYKYIGYETCALCLESIERFIKLHGKQNSSTDKCSICSLASIEACTKKESIYEQIVSILYRGKKFRYITPEHEILATHNDLMAKVDLMIQNLKKIS